MELYTIGNLSNVKFLFNKLNFLLQIFALQDRLTYIFQLILGTFLAMFGHEKVKVAQILTFSLQFFCFNFSLILLTSPNIPIL